MKKDGIQTRKRKPKNLAGKSKGGSTTPTNTPNGTKSEPLSGMFFTDM